MNKHINNNLKLNIMIKSTLYLLLVMFLLVICSFAIPISVSTIISIITPLEFQYITSTIFFWISVVVCGIITYHVLFNIDDEDDYHDNVYGL